MTPPVPNPPDDADADLRRALRDLPPDPADADPAALAALQRRVMAGWAAGHAASVREVHLVPAAPGTGSAAGPAGRPGDPARAWRILAAGALALAAAAAVVVGWQRTDPAVDELMRLDVLSQIAAGEL